MLLAAALQAHLQHSCCMPGQPFSPPGSSMCVGLCSCLLASRKILCTLCSGLSRHHVWVQRCHLWQGVDVDCSHRGCVYAAVPLQAA